jgi:hypothetical protein
MGMVWHQQLFAVDVAVGVTGVGVGAGADTNRASAKNRSSTVMIVNLLD